MVGLAEARWQGGLRHDPGLLRPVWAVRSVTRLERTGTRRSDAAFQRIRTNLQHAAAPCTAPRHELFHVEQVRYLSLGQLTSFQSLHAAHPLSRRFHVKRTAIPPGWLCG